MQAGLDARYFAWPPEHDPGRSPYRGLRPLEAEDAGIFFGRDGPVVLGLDMLRGLREAAAPRLLVILGASGAGKSSFMRAGLMPRLAREDQHFLTLPIVRPERAAITGETGLIASLEQALRAAGLARTRADIRAAVSGGFNAVIPVLMALQKSRTSQDLASGVSRKPPTMILPIDQAEELFLAEGAEEVKGASSMPIAKAMDDCILAYGMNGEAVRPQNGFPLRLMVPGFEGIFHTKWLRRIKVVDRYYMNYNDFGHLDRDPKVAALDYQIGPKSVITFPSAGQQLPGKGFYEISGLAWSGGGAIKLVEVSTDGGKRWSKAEIKGTAQRMAHARFGYMWNWDGQETELLSRCTDEIGQVQPSREQIAKYWNKPFDATFSVPGLDNSIQPWRIASDGSVTNGFA